MFALLYHYAYTKRVELELNEYETLCTRHAMIHFTGFAGVGVIVVIAALVLPARVRVAMPGFLFCLKRLGLGRRVHSG